MKSKRNRFDEDEDEETEQTEEIENREEPSGKSEEEIVEETDY